MRTTHLTGMITDIGIELGKLAFWHRGQTRDTALKVHPDRKKLGILSRVVAMFFLGGIVGALGFGNVGYAFAVPLAALLLGVCAPQMIGVGRRH
jgi:hypothetical protein